MRVGGMGSLLQVRILTLLWAVACTSVWSNAARAAAPESGAAGPTINLEPTNVTVVSGQSASFTVNATGTGTLSYQWKRGTTNVGTNSQTLTINPATPADAGSYMVVVTDSTGSTNSSAATLTVNVPATINTPPSSVTAIQGQTATFTVVAGGTTPFTYAWKQGTVPVGTNSPTLTINPVLTSSAGTYTVTVTNVANPSGASASATLTVTPATPPAITTPPVATTAIQGQSATFTVVASGSTPLTYVWKQGTTVVGGNSPTLTINPVQTSSAGTYTVTVSNAANSVTSAGVTLTVTPATAPAITTPPASVTAVVGSTASFTVVASGSTPLTYAWKFGTMSVGTNSPTLTINPVLATSGGTYTVTVSNAANPTGVSASAILTLSPPIITVPPASLSVALGLPATFTVTATGTGTLSYQWKFGTTPVGTNSPTFTIPATVAGNAGSYTVTVTDTIGSTTSAAATLTLTPPVPPSITVQPLSITVVVGHTATFSVIATGTPTLKYQWYRGGTAIAGATSATYTTAATTLADSGALFTVTVSNPPETTVVVTSNPATLTVDSGISSLPIPWLDADVGTVVIAGDASLSGSAATVCGSGAGISGTADAFHFLYQPLTVTGDGSVTALVTPGSTKATSLAGVMIRETLTPNSAGAGMFVTGAGGTLSVERLTTGAVATLTAGTPVTVPIPYWVRVDRTGNVLTSSISPDGISWTVVKSDTIVMAPGSYIGLAVTSADTTVLDCSTFASIGGTGFWSPYPKAAGSGGGGGGGCGLLGLEGLLGLAVLRGIL